jgi:erythromycin esterase-like protein
MNWTYADAQPYDEPEKARLADCARLAANASSAKAAAADRVMLDDIATYFERERGAAGAGTAKVMDRDEAMARHVAWWMSQLPPASKLVVWTATTHAARGGGAESTQPLGVMSMGARLAAQFGDRVAAIGFTALRGEWARAGRPAQTLAALPADSLEARALAAENGAATPWAFLDQAALSSIAAAPSRLFGKVMTANWADAFDAVVVIRDEVAPVFDVRK